MSKLPVIPLAASVLLAGAHLVPAAAQTTLPERARMRDQSQGAKTLAPAPSRVAPAHAAPARAAPGGGTRRNRPLPPNTASGPLRGRGDVTTGGTAAMPSATPGTALPAPVGPVTTSPLTTPRATPR